MVLQVHGGPQTRDRLGLSTTHQLLANRGYEVLSVNFRGSTRFRKAFVKAGNREWGTSYGGYAAFVGLSMTPEVFACGVAFAPPSNLVTLLSSLSAFFVPLAASIKARVGDWTTAEGRAALEAVSPLSHVDRIQRPLLIAQGSNDARVPQRESEQIVGAMQRAGVPVTYVVFADEGHALRRNENMLAHAAVVEAFLGAQLGGRVEPVAREDLAGSSLRIEAGREHLPGLPNDIQTGP